MRTLLSRVIAAFSIEDAAAALSTLGDAYPQNQEQQLARSGGDGHRASRAHVEAGQMHEEGSVNKRRRELQELQIQLLKDKRTATLEFTSLVCKIDARVSTRSPTSAGFTATKSPSGSPGQTRRVLLDVLDGAEGVIPCVGDDEDEVRACNERRQNSASHTTANQSMRSASLHAREHEEDGAHTFATQEDVVAPTRTSPTVASGDDAAVTKSHMQSTRRSQRTLKPNRRLGSNNVTNALLVSYSGYLSR